MNRKTDSLTDWAETTRPNGLRTLTLRCSNDIATQVERRFGLALGDRLPLQSVDQGEWTHRFPLRRPISQEEEDFLALLHEVVTLRLGPPFLVAIALNFYQDPTSSEDKFLWKKTPVGQFFHDAKYGGDPTAGKSLARQLHGFIERHPDFAATEVIVVVPSHSGARFSERLAAAVSRLTGLPVVIAREVGGDQTPVKGKSTEERMAQSFSVDPSQVRGRRVLVIDDMVRSGQTLLAVAEAAISAGAASVCGLAAVRTMRN